MSQRALAGLLAILASGVALLGKFGGLYRGWEARVPAAFQLPIGQGAIPLWLECVCAGLFAWGTAIVGLQITAPRFRLGLLLAILLQPISAMAVGVLAGTWVSPFTWIVAIASSLLGIALYRFSGAGKRERRVRTIFGKHLSPAALERLSLQQNPWESKSIHATILSARYLGKDWSVFDSTANRLREKSAWVEQQTGHRLLAVWDVPLAVPDSPETAVETTLGFGSDWQVGVATSEVVGELLDNEQWQMHGAAFEKADALAQANTTFGSRVLMDLATTDLVRDSIVSRPVDFLTLPGNEMGMEVFEPLALSREASEEAVAQRDRFWKAVIYFRQKRFSEAMAAFQKAGNDAVVQYYLARLEKLTS